MAMPAAVGARLLIEAKSKDQAEQIRAEWVALLPVMQAGFIKLVQWQDYLDTRLGKNIDRRPAAVIIAELEELHGRRLL